MKKGREAILERRAHLVARAALERDELAEQLQLAFAPLAIVERGVASLRGLRGGAKLIGIGLGAVFGTLALTRSLRIPGWIKGGVTVWQIARGALGLLRS